MCVHHFIFGNTLFFQPQLLLLQIITILLQHFRAIDLSLNTPKMSSNLAWLPLELLMKINFYLGLQDYVNLQASCKRLRASLKADGTCRDYVKVFAEPVDL